MYIYIKMTIIYTVEGNIGSGKSTLVKLLKKQLSEIIPDANFIFLQEPVDVWETIKDNNGKTIIEKFYANQEKYSFSFQMMAYISRLSQITQTMEKNPNAVIITERSVFTDRNVFAKMLYDAGKMESINYEIYNKWFYEFIKKTPLSGIIYLDTKPEKCLERVKFRKRPGEDIPIEYLSNCKKYHDEWINGEANNSNINNSNINKIDILTLDGNTDFLDIPDTMDKMLSDIKNFIEKKIPKKNIEFDISVHIC